MGRFDTNQRRLHSVQALQQQHLQHNYHHQHTWPNSGAKQLLPNDSTSLRMQALAVQTVIDTCQYYTLKL